MLRRSVLFKTLKINVDYAVFVICLDEVSTAIKWDYFIRFDTQNLRQLQFLEYFTAFI